MDSFGHSRSFWCAPVYCKNRVAGQKAGVLRVAVKGDMPMSGFRAIALDTDLAKRVRASRFDPFGAKAEVWTARDSRLPCRHCLNEARLNSEVLLISYQPLEKQTPYAGRGPIFICGDECEGFDRAQTVPEIVAARQVNLRAYDGSGKMLYAYSRLAKGNEAKDHLAEMLKDEDVFEVHAHTALHGCFLCKFIRA
jgi:hypothetical protein